MFGGPSGIGMEQDHRDACTKLLDYQKQGDVFHGSTNPNIEQMEPRRVHGDETSEFNNDVAIYASSIPSGPVLFGCMNKDLIPSEIRSGNWSVGFDDSGEKIVAKIPAKWRQAIEQMKGYVYVLPCTTFQHEEEGVGWQVKSTQPVKPKDKIAVQFSDFQKLGGVVEWTE